MSVQYARYNGLAGSTSGGGGGNVSSVALADGSTVPLYSISGSPVTTSGTLTFTLQTQSANTVLAGPTSGGASQPAFRALVTADLPFAIGNLTDAGTDGITVTGGTGSVIGSGTSLSQHVADTTHNGYLSSTDWNTFNGKQASGNYITALTGDVTASGPGSVASTLSTVNSNVGSFGSSTAIPSFTVNGKGLVTAASTNVVIAPAGTLTGTTLASNVITSSLTSVGTITSGVWTGTSIAIANGGTGQGTKAAAFDALSPMTTGGDIIYGGASGTGTRLANGTAGQVLTSGGTTVAPTWTTITTSAPNDNFAIENLTLTTSVAANALTIAVKTSAGADPSAGDKCTISFRSSTASAGTYVQETITSALSLVVPSGATLGATSAVNQYIYVVAIDNAGTVELGVIGSRFDLDEGSLQTSTTIGGSSTDWNTIYSTTGRSSKAIRILGRLLSNQATAGTYASAITEISLSNKYLWPLATSWKTDLTWTYTNLGTTSNANVMYKRISDTLHVKGGVTAGATTNNVSIGFPAGLTIDTAKTLSPVFSSGNMPIGMAYGLGNANTITAAGFPMVVSIPATTFKSVTFSYISDSNGLFGGTTAKQADNQFWSFWWEVPIKEWRSY